MNRKMKSFLLTAAGLLFLSGTAMAEDVSFPTDDPWLTFHILPEGDNVTVEGEQATSGYTMSQNEIGTLEHGTEFWETYLRSNAAPGSTIPIVVIPIDTRDNNAAAISLPIPGDSQSYSQWAGMTELSAAVIHGYRDFTYNVPGYASIIMVNRPETEERPWDTGPILTLPKNGENMNLSSTIAHEIFHALGIASSAGFNDRYGYNPEDADYPGENLGYGFTLFDNVLTKWDNLLRDVNHNTATPGELIVTAAQANAFADQGNPCTATTCFIAYGYGVGPQTPDGGDPQTDPANWLIGDGTPESQAAETAYPTHGGVYLTGENILTVLKSGMEEEPVEMRVPSDAGFELTVPGIPVNTWEADYNVEDDATKGLHYNAEFSHIELQNSLMSHQMYRNWGSFMEAELAVLQDMGYTLDRRDFYGFSIYRDEIVGENDNPFYARENGAYVTGKPNTNPWGIGLHIYGAENEITQTADLLADGFSGIGVRVDGWNNVLTVAPETTVTANGEYGHGILFSYGKEQNLVLRGTVKATGYQGKAVAFDFGDNMLSNVTEYRGSYIRTKISVISDDWTDAGDLLPELNGELITKADITGSVTGSEAAVYIGPSAFVREINIMNGAAINGDIVSDWKPVTNSRMLHNSAPAPDELVTDLMFGLTPDANGKATGTPDASFNATVNGNIEGSEGLDMALMGGKLTVNGTINVHTLGTETGTVLSLQVNNDTKAVSIVSADEITIRGVLDYTFDPTINGLKQGDVISVLDAETALTWAETDEKFSLDSIFDRYSFEYLYNQTEGTLGLRVASAQSKTQGTQSSHAMTSSVVNAIGNKIMGRLNGGGSIGGYYASGGYYGGKNHSGGGSSYGKGQSGGDGFNETGLWGKALYTHAHRSGENAFKADIYGGVVGLDEKFSDEVTLGIAAAFSKTDGEAGKTDANANTYAGYLYGQYERGKWTYNLAAGYGVSRFDVDNTPKFNVRFANAQGYVDYYLGRGFSVESGARYTFTHQDEYKVGTTTFKAEDTHTLTGVFGGRYAWDSRRFGIRMNAGAIYDFISDKSAFRATNRGASMYVKGDRLHRLGGEAGIAAIFRTRSWTFELGYDAQVRKDYNDQTVSLKAGYRF